MERARQLRRTQTDAECRLWSRLRAAQLGVKFRRQHPVAAYYADFCCVEYKLIVELDGGQHLDQQARDAQRTQDMQAAGFRVMRFSNDDALLRTDDVLGVILRALGEGAFHALHLRAVLYRLIRRFFAERDVLEVETPMLSAAGNTEPNIDSFSTQFTGHVDAGARERWLRTSAEFPMKRLLAAGVGDCYELGRVFRNGEAGGRHNPEFTMLEWYRVGWDHRQLMHEAITLVEAALALVQRRVTIRIVGYRQLFLDELGLDPMLAPIAELQAPLAAQHIDPQDLSRDDWLDLLMTHRLQPHFARDCITVVHDYPATQCSLARIRPGAPPVAERFELYLGPLELANGYHELNDAREQRARFEHDNQRRAARETRQLPLDEPLLAALDDLPDCAGVALGIERLLMAMTDTDAIADVLAFPFGVA